MEGNKEDADAEAVAASLTVKICLGMLIEGIIILAVSRKVEGQ